MSTQPQADISANMVGNIVGLVNEATIEERAAGLAWYPAYGHAIEAYGASHSLDREHALALFAALSPRARIQRNWANFKAACQTHTTQGCVCLTGKHRAKVAAFLAGLSSIEAVTSGPKVTAFYANLSGDLSQVTIDRHAVAGALGHCPDNDRISCADYRKYALAYQAASKLLDLEPAQTQAIAWIVWRRKKGIKDNGGLSLVA
jgi:hypothetical protein